MNSTIQAISSLSALVAGFAMVVLVELTVSPNMPITLHIISSNYLCQVPEDTNPILLIIFSIATGLVVPHLMATLSS